MDSGGINWNNGPEPENFLSSLVKEKRSVTFTENSHWLVNLQTGSYLAKRYVSTSFGETQTLRHPLRLRTRNKEDKNESFGCPVAFFEILAILLWYFLFYLINATYGYSFSLMGQLLNLVQPTFFLNKFSFYQDRPTTLFQQKPCSYVGNCALQKHHYHGLQLSFPGYTT